MLSPRFRKRLWIALALAAAAVLCLAFIVAYPVVGGDTVVYGGIAKNWMLHGVYGIVGPAPKGLHPTLIRLPGYPLFLVACFSIFGIEHYRAVMFVQVAMDLATCLLIADFARRIWNERAGWYALWLAALCPFLASYTAAPLTETPEILCIALAFWTLPRWIETGAWRWTLLMALAWSYAALLRPDGALLAVALFPAMILAGRRTPDAGRMLRRALLCGAISILPFLPWTLRNWRTFHVFQPLAPRYAEDPGESSYPGFNRWTRTLCVDLACTSDIYWNVNIAPIDPANLPARAFDTPAEKRETLTLLDEYDRTHILTPRMDAAFAQLAAGNIRRHPFRCYVLLPLARLADMWLRPRTDLLWIDVHWWRYRADPSDTVIGLEFAALNLAYLAAALLGFLRRPPWAFAMLAFVLLRCALLLTIQAPEPRYTLECFPPLIALAAIGLSQWKLRKETGFSAAEAGDSQSSSRSSCRLVT